MTAAALKFPKAVQIPTPAIALGPTGRKLWDETITAFGDWIDAELRTLCLACLALDEVEKITAELASETDFKARRQLRADRNAASTTYRQQMRELSLAARPADSRPQRIAGRYA